MPQKAPPLPDRQASRVAQALSIMQNVLDVGLDAGKTLEEIHHDIRRAYPWGKRNPSTWPYKAWLIARREFYLRNRLPGLRPTRAQHEPQALQQPHFPLRTYEARQ